MKCNNCRGASFTRCAGRFFHSLCWALLSLAVLQVLLQALVGLLPRASRSRREVASFEYYSTSLDQVLQ